MKIIIVVSALMAITVADIIEEFYKTANDNLDVDTVAKDPIAVKRYLDCFMDKGPCDIVAQSYKILISDALKTACLKCNPAQKYLWNRFLYHMKAEYPKELEAFQQKYDPSKILIPAIEKVVANYASRKN